MTRMSMVVVGLWIYVALWASIARATRTKISWWSALIVYLGCAFAAIFGFGHSERGRLSEERREFLLATSIWVLLVSPIVAYYFPATWQTACAGWVVTTLVLEYGEKPKHATQSVFTPELGLAFRILIALAFTRLLALMMPNTGVFYVLWSVIWFNAAVINVSRPSVRYYWQTRQIDQDVQRAKDHLNRTNAA